MGAGRLNELFSIKINMEMNASFFPKNVSLVIGDSPLTAAFLVSAQGTGKVRSVKTWKAWKQQNRSLSILPTHATGRTPAAVCIGTRFQDTTF